MQVSDDAINGLGTAQNFLRNFFGSLFLVAKTPPLSPHPSEYTDMSEMAVSPAGPLPAVSQTPLPPRPVDLNPVALIVEAQEGAVESFKTVLIACVPNPGYFVAGGLAGIVSRTSTAPLDRLKVYLIAQTSVARDAVALAKSGNVFLALANSWRPLVDAMKELWKAGGMRSLYAGRSLHMTLTPRQH